MEDGGNKRMEIKSSGYMQSNASRKEVILKKKIRKN